MKKLMILALCFTLGGTAIYAQNTNTPAPPSEPVIAGTLNLHSNKTLVTNEQLNSGTIIVEDATLHYVASATIVANEQKETLIDLNDLPSGIYYVKGMHNGVKVLYKVIKP
jgi:aromatic ring-opening dioxygenase catalytic subunit (LigB family)